MEFFDTSVLIAAFWTNHPGHDASNHLLSLARKQRSACGIYTLAEVYSSITSLPIKNRITPQETLLFIEELRRRLSVIALTEEEYVKTIEKAAELGFTSGKTYDALLLACAAKSEAKVIYTWNVKHFRAIDPNQADTIRTP